MLEDEADVAVAHIAAGDILAMEHDAAAVRRFQPGDDAQQAGLAAAGRAEQGDQFAALDVQVDRLQRLELAEALVDVTDFDTHGCAPVFRRAMRDSLHCLSSRITSARASSRLATLNAATWLYSL